MLTKNYTNRLDSRGIGVTQRRVCLSEADPFSTSVCHYLHCGFFPHRLQPPAVVQIGILPGVPAPSFIEMQIPIHTHQGPARPSLQTLRRVIPMPAPPNNRKQACASY